MYSVEQRGSVTVVAVSGAIDLASRAAFTRILAPSAFAPESRIIVDLTDCSYIDSSGLSVLIRAHKENGERLRVVVPSREAVYRVFKICNLDRLFHMVATADEASEDGVV